MTGADVRVVQRGDRTRFLFEACQPAGVAREDFQKDSDRGVAIEPRVAGFVDLTHSTGAEWRLDFVRTETRASDEHQRNARIIPAWFQRLTTKPSLGGFAVPFWSNRPGTSHRHAI